MKRALLLAAGALLALTACSGGVTPFATVASSPGSIGLGEQRVLFALIDRDTDEYLAAEDRPATMTLRDENGAPIETYSMEFIWTVPDVRGIYVAHPVIPEAGTYQVTIDAEGLQTAGPMGLVAVEDPSVVQVGEAAPITATRTSHQFPIEVISSDPEPDPAFYVMSADEAVTNGRPSVIVFATPAWCVSATCGPLLDQVKALSSGYPGVDFIHIEVYEDIQVSSRDDLVLVPPVIEWGLLAEPWLFVVDADGMVTGSFEGAASDAELAEAFEAVAG